MSYSKLRGRIKEVFGTQDSFACAMGLSKSGLSMRLNNRIRWTLDEVRKACDFLYIPESEIGTYFFTRKVQ